MCEWQKQVTFEAALRVGDVVEARWTNCYEYYRVAAVIVRVNRKSVRVRLLRAQSGYPEGWEIPIPRFDPLNGNNRWSVNNGVFPIDGDLPSW